MLKTNDERKIVEEFIAAGGRLTHVRRSRGRVLTIAYYKEKDNPKVVFAGSMFTPDEENPVFTREWKRKNNVNAIQRFVVCPKVIFSPLPHLYSTDNEGRAVRQYGSEDGALRDYIVNKVVPVEGIYSRAPNSGLLHQLIRSRYIKTHPSTESAQPSA